MGGFQFAGYVGCAKGNGGACKAAADAAIALGTGLLGKGAKVVFKGFKAAFKKGDSVPIECLVGGGRHSFTPGTLVLMADGSTKPIEDVRIGDETVVTDPETGRTTIRKVVATIVTEDDKHFVDLTVSRKGARAAEPLTSTTTHPFWSPSEGAWLHAGELEPGMTLRTADGGTAEVMKTHEYRRLQRTHDLTVDGIHTYYVLAGETPVLVHNTGGSDDPGSFSGTVFRDGKYRFQIYSNDHGPAHGHLIGPGIKGDGIQIGQNGKPLDPKVQLTKDQQRVIDNNLRDIRKAIRKSMAAHRSAGGNGC